MLCLVLYHCNLVGYCHRSSLTTISNQSGHCNNSKVHENTTVVKELLNNHQFYSDNNNYRIWKPGWQALCQDRHSCMVIGYKFLTAC